MAGELECPCCRKPPALRDLDTMIWDLICERRLSENAQSVLEALFIAAGRPVQAETFFERMYEHDPDGGPSYTQCYSDLREALDELTGKGKLDGTGLAVVHQGRPGWRLILNAGGAYVA